MAILKGQTQQATVDAGQKTNQRPDKSRYIRDATTSLDDNSGLYTPSNAKYFPSSSEG